MSNELLKPLLVEQYLVPILERKVRIQDIAANMFTRIPTKSGLKKAIKNKLVFLNGHPVSTGTFLFGGETLELYQYQKSKSNPNLELELKVIFQDDYLALVNKPAGITVSGNKRWTLENALAYNLFKSPESDALNHPEPIHRLDHPTSGIILIGKTSNSVIALNKLFEERKIKKTYYAISTGAMLQQKTINTPIDGKPSSTYYTIIDTLVSEKYGSLNLVHVSPHTGRKHQIRKHLSEQGNPILGDSMYSEDGKTVKGNGLYLHAYSLEFIHPITNQQMYFSADLTKKFTRLFPKLKRSNA